MTSNQQNFLQTYNNMGVKVYIPFVYSLNELEGAVPSLVSDPVDPSAILTGQITSQVSSADGYYQSANFIHLSKGWRIDAEGNAEFNNGLFRGSFTVTGSINLVGVLQTVFVGQDIQAAINSVAAAGGGTVILEAGTHTPNYDLVLKSGVHLQGQSFFSTIIDFGGNAHQILIQGLNNYTTGGVTCNFGDMTIVGTGTVWTAAMIGRSIFLDGLWYVISGVTNNTHLTIATPFAGQDLLNAAYGISDPILDTAIEGIKIKNSSIAGVKINFANDFNCSITWIESCANCFDVSYTYSFLLSDCYCYYSTGDGLKFNICGGSVITSNTIVGSVGVGINCTLVTNTVFQNCICFLGSEGMTLNGCTAMGIFGSTFSRNFGIGLQLSNCGGIAITSVGTFGNASDGIQFTTNVNACIVGNCILQSNVGYGWNIVDASSNINTMHANSYYLNTAGAFNNAGTGTITNPIG